MNSPILIPVLLTPKEACFIAGCPDEIREKYFAFRPQGYRWMPAYRRGQWNGFIHLMKFRRCSAALFAAVRPIIEKETSYRFEVLKDSRQKLERSNDKSLSGRSYQNECTEAMLNAEVGGLVLCATGSGKTRIAGNFFRKIKGRGLFVVDELTLLHQSRREIAETMGLPITKVGIIGEGKAKLRRITVCTIQTLSNYQNSKTLVKKADKAKGTEAVYTVTPKDQQKRFRFREWIRGLDAIVLDEYHVAQNDRVLSVVKEAGCRVYGLTATLNIFDDSRDDSGAKDLKNETRLKAYECCGPVLYEYPLETGIEEGHLGSGIAVLVEFPQVEQVDVSTEYSAVYDRIIVENKARNKLIAGLATQAVKAGRPTVILVERKRHLTLLSNLLKCFVKHEVVSGDVKGKARVQLCRRFERGELDLIISSRVFTKGVNLKRIACIIDGSAMAGQNAARQKFGRGTRKLDGKDGLIYFDISDKGTYSYFDHAARFRELSLTGRGMGIRVGKVNGMQPAAKIFRIAERVLTRTLNRAKRRP